MYMYVYKEKRERRQKKLQNVLIFLRHGKLIENGK